MTGAHPCACAPDPDEIGKLQSVGHVCMFTSDNARGVLPDAKSRETERIYQIFVNAENKLRP